MTYMTHEDDRQLMMLSDEREAILLDCLTRVAKAGLVAEARILASECGVVFHENYDGSQTREAMK